MSVKIRHPGPKLTDAALAAVEKDLGVTLPADYRAFLLAHNGGARPRGFRYKNETGPYTDGAVEEFLSVATGKNEGRSLEYAVQNLKRDETRIPKRMIPIASDIGGNVVCLSVAGADVGKIYFWHYEEESDQRKRRGGDVSDDALHLLADSFDEFLSHLSDDDADKVPAWMEPIEDGDVDAVRRWLDAGGNPLSTEHPEWLPLSYAVSEGRVEIVELFIARGGVMPEHAMQFAVAYLQKPLMRALAARRATLAAALADVHGNPRLWTDTEMIQLLLDAGADVNGRGGGTNRTPLHLAAEAGAAEAVALLLSRGAAVNVWDATNRTALHLAVVAGSAPCAKLLVDAGEDLHATPPVVGDPLQEFIDAYVEVRKRLPPEDMIEHQRKMIESRRPPTVAALLKLVPAAKRIKTEVEAHAAAKQRTQ